MPQATAQRYGIEILGVNITVGGRGYTEMHDITSEEFWDLLESVDEIPQTAQITPVRYFERFDAARERGVTHLLVITMNSRGSGTHNSCHVARQMFEDEHPGAMQIEILDGRSYSMIFGQAVLHAALMREGDAAFNDIVAECDDMLHRNEAVIIINSLKQLRKSGRIKGGAAFVGEALGLKPIVYAADCELNVVGKARGEKAVIPAIMDMVAKNVRKPESQRMYIAYAKANESDLRELERQVRERFGPLSLERIPLGASVTINAGARVFGVIYLGDKRE